MKRWVLCCGIVLLLSGGCMTPFYGDKALSVTEGKDRAVITFDPRGQQMEVFYFTKTDEYDFEKAFPVGGMGQVQNLPVNGSIEMYVNGRFYYGYHVKEVTLGWRHRRQGLFSSEIFRTWSPNPGISFATGTMDPDAKITAGTIDLSTIKTNVTTVVVMGDLAKFVKPNRHWRMIEPMSRFK